MKKAAAAIILAGLSALATSAYGRENPERERAMQRRLREIVADSRTEPVQKIQAPAERTNPTYQRREAAKLELSKEIDPEEKVKVAMGLRSDNQSNPEEIRIGVENRRGRIIYTSDFKRGKDRISTELNAGRGKIGINILDYKHTQINASVPVRGGVSVSAGHDSLERTTTGGVDYSKKAMSLSIRNIAYPDGTQRRNASANIKLPGELSATVSHNHIAYAGLPTNATSISLEKKIKDAPVSRVYINYDYATRAGQSYEGKKIGVEKKLDWLQVNAWAEKPAGMYQFHYGVQGNIKLSW